MICSKINPSSEPGGCSSGQTDPSSAALLLLVTLGIILKCFCTLSSKLFGSDASVPTVILAAPENVFMYKQISPENVFHIIAVFAFGQTSLQTIKITFERSLNTCHCENLRSITFSPENTTHASNVLCISDIIAYICCPSVYLRV